ncbi:MAG: endolytic transglycosylase MltG [Alphaproteobacteria bacterium]|nr:endolytic transglycosylase MltG [Alphaproteobacteria bacterium]
MNRLKQLFKNFRGHLLVAAIAGGLVIVSVLGLVYLPGPHGDTARVLLASGLSSRTIADTLRKSGVVRSALLFRGLVRISGEAANLRAGEYDIPANANMPAVLRVITGGDIVLHPITIAEGLTSMQIVDVLRAQDVLRGDAALPKEGSLLPETYNVARGMTRRALIAKMQSDQKRVIDTLWPKRQKNLPIKSKREALILASIVERETGIASERPLVAAVFTNRLRKKMRLQSDPTIIYGLVGGKGKLGRPIRRSEIRRTTPYNTYRINGLPPTPIANPGRDAIAAVLNPAASKALYFVADGTGGHAFAETLSQHNKNVRRWRQIEKQNRR